MRQLDEVTALLRQERGQLERMRHQVFAERLSFEKRRLQVAAGVAPSAGYTAVTVGGVAPAAAADGAASSSQQVR